MDAARSRQHTNLADTTRGYASSPCWMHEVDPSYLGYWSQEEVLVFLKSLLEQERIGTRAFADIGKAADLHTAHLILESELARHRFASCSKTKLRREGQPPQHRSNARPMNITQNAALSTRLQSRNLIKLSWSRRLRKPS